MLLTGLWCASAQALTLQSIGSFEEPIYVTSAPANPDRLFVVERRGRVIEVENGTRTVFTDLRSRVSCEPAPGECEGEGGLLSIALSPDFQTSGRLFVYYTGKEQIPAEIHIAELVASGGFAPLSSLRNLITIAHPKHNNHYGGQLQFGPDGALFAATGDGGGKEDQEENAQNPNSRLGKLLRIDPDGPISTADNWSLGLRNPFRFSFDRLTGALLIGDVGQDTREEVDYAPAPGLGAGANYGWNCKEGFQEKTVPPESGCATAGAFTEPIFDYPHDDPLGEIPHRCAIVGGFVARGPGYGDAYGRYLYGDNCGGEIRSLLPALPFASGDRSEGLGVESLDSFGEDSCGRLYAVSRFGPVYRIVGPGPTTCPTASQPKLDPSFVGIRGISRRVVRNRRTLITAWVSPCDGRRGDPVTLWRGRQLIGTRHLDRACTTRFRPKISRRSKFRATVTADDTYVAATSRKLTIKPGRRARR